MRYVYEPSGQIDNVSDMLAPVRTRLRQYHYDEEDHPNAVSSVTDGSATDAFTYDSAGRMLTRTVNSQMTQMTWDVSSNLTATEGLGGNVVYVYDAGGQRVAQIKVSELTGSATPVSATVYLGDVQATDANTASTSVGDVAATRFVTFGGATVATHTVTSTQSSWALLFGDVQGSAQVSMPLVPDALAGTGFADADATHIPTRDAYLPYGASRGGSDLAVDRGWLGQVEDSGTGLTYLNARYYDPSLGRFLSPDPLMNPGDPRTLDPYRYADNNPVVHKDDTGLFSACASLGKNAMTACMYSAAAAMVKISNPSVSRGPSILDPRSKQVLSAADARASANYRYLKGVADKHAAMVNLSPLNVAGRWALPDFNHNDGPMRFYDDDRVVESLKKYKYFTGSSSDTNSLGNQLGDPSRIHVGMKVTNIGYRHYQDASRGEKILAAVRDGRALLEGTAGPVANESIGLLGTFDVTAEVLEIDGSNVTVRVTASNNSTLGSLVRAAPGIDTAMEGRINSAVQNSRGFGVGMYDRERQVLVFTVTVEVG